MTEKVIKTSHITMLKPRCVSIMEKFISNSTYKFIVEILVPILSSLLSGLIAFGVAKYTISKERKLDIKPFLVVREYDLCSENENMVYFNSHYWEECLRHFNNEYVYKWWGLPLQNASSKTCVLKYIVLNQRKYQLDYFIVLQPNEKIVIKAKDKEESRDSIGILITEKKLLNIKLGVSDMLRNEYEYNLKFAINNSELKFIEIDCR